MKYLIPLMMLSSFSLYAESCLPLYEKKASEIQKENGHKEYIGGHIYEMRGRLGYWPGMQIDADIPNWAEDFVLAVRSGRAKGNYEKSIDERQYWIDIFTKTIEDDCDLAVDRDEKLKSMLMSLMEDGSFCPGQKIIEPSLWKGKSAFKKVLKEAVKDGRFPEYCNKNNAVTDDSTREIKDLNFRASSHGAKPAKANQK